MEKYNGPADIVGGGRYVMKDGSGFPSQSARNKYASVKPIICPHYLL